ncbi:MAG TPA: hypothetical protein VFD64_04305 [Gemmatimonadaceae bacterium]|nr:hypothetical protein [Gemmatimonadaceae bacterium]
MPLRSLVIALLLPALVSAQSTRRSLPAPTGQLNVEFSDLTSVRELADGRVLLFDRKEERLVVADFTTGSVKDVARKGQGPTEFEFVAALLPLAGDTTIAADLTRRWLVLVGDSVVRKLLPEHPALQRIALAPLGADRVHVLSRSFGERRDSSGVVLVNRTSGDADTVARLANEGRRSPVLGTATIPGLGTSARFGNIPLRSSESPFLFPDGWIAIVRLDPYRVDWRAPDGRWTLGAPLPFRTGRMTAAEKAAYILRKPGFRNATDWPDELPPFEDPMKLLGSPEGFVLVTRLVTRAEPGTRYDVIDKTGKRRGQLVLGNNEHILGFGTTSVYVIATDSDGIQRLRRHPWLASLRP